jgi:ABC-2 type transport system permease protein
MKSSVFWALVRKDVYVLRAFMYATLAIGVLSVGLVRFGKIGFAVGGVLFLTANVGSGIFISMYSLLTERKNRSRAFALSLPISGANHDRSKLVSGYIVFGLPWLVLTALAMFVFLAGPPATRGMVVYAVMIQVFVLALFSVVQASLFVVKSEAQSGIVILITNICFSLFMVTVNQQHVTAPLRTAQIVWTPFSQRVLAGELLVVGLTLVFVAIFTARQRDYL